MVSYFIRELNPEVHARLECRSLHLSQPNNTFQLSVMSAKSKAFYLALNPHIGLQTNVLGHSSFWTFHPKQYKKWSLIILASQEVLFSAVLLKTLKMDNLISIVTVFTKRKKLLNIIQSICLKNLKLLKRVASFLFANEEIRCAPRRRSGGQWRGCRQP